MRETLFDFASNKLYKHVSRLGDRLNHIRDNIGWKSYDRAQARSAEQLLAVFAYNLYQLFTLKKKGVVADHSKK